MKDARRKCHPATKEDARRKSHPATKKMLGGSTILLQRKDAKKCHLARKEKC